MTFFIPRCPNNEKSLLVVSYIHFFLATSSKIMPGLHMGNLKTLNAFLFKIYIYIYN